MGTTSEFNIVVTRIDRAGVKKACDLAESRIGALDKMLSVFEESSEVARINNDNKKTAVVVPRDLFRLVERAKEFFALTQGAFDVTVGPLTGLWGFGSAKKTVPDASKIREVLNRIGLDKIDLDRQGLKVIFKDPGIEMDFGGLAKGYAVDEAVRVLKDNRVTNGIVNIGGDLYCMGTNYSDKKWAIGVRDPENTGKNLVVLEITDGAIATSGNYENFYIYENKRYTHIIDPRTGYTVTNELESVTVIAEDCATADALATAVFVLGERDGLGLIEQLPGIECLLIAGSGPGRSLIMSSGMERFVRRDET